MRRMPFLLLWIVAACATSGTGSAPVGELPHDEVCEAQADRWFGVQQALLDDLGDATPDVVVDPPPSLTRAFEVAAASLIEIERDARQVDCSEAVTVGGALLCARTDELRASGPGGAELIATLAARC